MTVENVTKKLGEDLQIEYVVTHSASVDGSYLELDLASRNAASLDLLHVDDGGNVDDLYAINLAKTEFREAFNTGDPERLIALLDPAFVYRPDGVSFAVGIGAADAIRAQFRELTARYNVQLFPIIIEIRTQDTVAYDYGWHVWQKTPRDGGPQVTIKNRYVDIWRKSEKGEWKLWMHMSNSDVPIQIPTAA